MAVKIRKAKRADFDKLLELNQKLFLYEKKYGDTYDENWPYSVVGKTYFATRLENGIIFVAEDRSLIVAYICAYIETFPFRNVNPIAEIENMFVEENLRGKGIGTKLISKVVSEVKSKGVRLMKVGSLDENSAAVSFYGKNGFNRHEIFLERKI